MSLDMELDIVGQQPGLQIYTQLSCIFRCSPSKDPEALIKTLRQGLESVAIYFPWTAGQVVNTAARPDHTGTFRIVPFEKTAPLKVSHRRDISSLEEMKAAGWPMKMLDESVFAPRMTIPTPEEQKQPWPVVATQATFIKGGLILTFAAQHNVMDMMGQAAFMRLLSKACNGETPSEQEMDVGNKPRTNLFPLIEQDTAHQVQHQIGKNGGRLPEKHRSSWAYFFFSEQAVSSIKSAANETLSSGFVSADDALSAFIWRAITRARLPRLQPESDKTQLGRAVDVRRSLGLPPNYPGIMQNMTYNNASVQDLLSLPLGTIAHQLRANLDSAKLRRETLALATFIHDRKNPAVSFTADLDLSKDVAISSWAKVHCYEDDYGLGLGPPINVLRPRFVPVEGLVYFMPKHQDGTAVALCLRDEDMVHIKDDSELRKLASFRG